MGIKLNSSVTFSGSARRQGIKRLRGIPHTIYTQRAVFWMPSMTTPSPEPALAKLPTLQLA